MPELRTILIASHKTMSTVAILVRKTIVKITSPFFSGRDSRMEMVWKIAQT